MIKKCDHCGIWYPANRSDQRFCKTSCRVAHHRADAPPPAPPRQRDPAGDQRAPAAIWPTDNTYGIPLLDLRLCGDALDAPILMYGSMARNKMRGTVHFYTDDYRFTGLWDDPTPIVNSACVSVVEVNYSLEAGTPAALALFHIYKKRWISRYFQSKGIRIFVDLNVPPNYGILNLMGIPSGWTAYATRGYSDGRIEWLLYQWELAQHTAGDNTPLFAVYAGGARVEELCKANGWIYLPDQTTEAHTDNGRT